MKTYMHPEAAPQLFDGLMEAISKLKERLQQHYLRAYPDLPEIIRYVIEEEQANAWNLSPSFPHLVLPDLVEAHIAPLGLQPKSVELDEVPAPSPPERPASAVGHVYASLVSEAGPTHQLSLTA